VDHDWSGWGEDEPHLGDHLADGDTADLHEPSGGLEDLGGLDGDHGFEPDHFAGFEHHDSEPQHFEPAPDDAHDYVVQDHDSSGYDPQDYGLAHHDFDVRDLHDNGHDAGPTDEHDPARYDEQGEHDAPAEHLVGTDPDVDSHSDADAWYDHSFPPPLELEHVPEPVDGFPWSDPSVLGHGLSEPAGELDGGYGAPPVTDLFEYSGLDAGTGGDAWTQLIGSDDPAAGALARWWAPS
jgi:hypothetical protein